MCQPPPREAVATVLRKASSHAAAVDKILALRLPGLQRNYQIQLADGSSMVLVMAPPSMLRLLRSEQRLTVSEAAVLRWLSEELVPDKEDSARPGAQRLHDLKPSIDSRGTSSGAPVPERVAGLLTYLPRLVAHSSAPDELGAPFMILETPRGTPVASLTPPPTPDERAIIDYQTGRLLRSLSRLSPASSRFGPALSVLSPTAPTASRPTQVEGTTTWSMAFHSLLESVLRDGEDMGIMLAYGAIRKHFRRLGHLLDAVTVPRLVVLDSLYDANVLVTREDVAEGSASTATEKTNTPSTTVPAGKLGDDDVLPKAGSDDDEHRDDNEKHPKSRLKSDPPTSSYPLITVTALRGWGNCFYGDPLLAPILCDNPTTDLMRGFEGLGETDQPGLDAQANDGVIEDPETAPLRVLLYRCYHTTVQIVTEFYRPTSDSSRRELAARKRLGGILTMLEEAESPPPKGTRHRRMSGEMSPAKRSRLGEPSEGGGKAATKDGGQ